jgi:hypothetical protein
MFGLGDSGAGEGGGGAPVFARARSFLSARLCTVLHAGRAGAGGASSGGGPGGPGGGSSGFEELLTFRDY